MSPEPHKADPFDQQYERICKARFDDIHDDIKVIKRIVCGPNGESLTMKIAKQGFKLNLLWGASGLILTGLILTALRVFMMKGLQ